MNKNYHQYLTIFSLIVIIAVANILIAGTDGTIRGKVVDQAGQPMAGAQVFISEISMGAMADAEGNYLILNIPVGSYDVTCSVIGYQMQNIANVDVIMDQTVWLNFSLKVSAIEGDVVTVTSERELVEKGSTAKKITISKEAIEALPIRDVTELYSLQSGVVKVESRQYGIPDHEDRGLDEIHVRGGRSGEIAYMIDGMYIRNPIFGEIGSGTRLNVLAVKEFDWQPGGFDAEYGDAMSAVSNYHTAKGGDKFSMKYKYSTSLVGALMGYEYDDLRGYNDYNFSIGGPLILPYVTDVVPFLGKINFWISGQNTIHDSYSVLEFDDLYYQEGDNVQNLNNLVWPWDNTSGFRAFGDRRTKDLFAKLSVKPTNKIRLNMSYWTVENQQKSFNPTFMYWDDGKTELFRDTERFFLEFNHSLTSRTFYSVRMARFIQDEFMGVRWMDSDVDGLPDWFEWRYGAGVERDDSNPYDPNMVPYYSSDNGDTVMYIEKDGRSGWYKGAPVPGNYNWDVAESFTDVNGNDIYDPGVDIFDMNCSDGDCDDIDGDGNYDGPTLIEKAYYRDGSYWLTPEMYEDHSAYFDAQKVIDEYIWDPWWYENVGFNPVREIDEEELYFLPTSEGYSWIENRAFGGSDRLYEESTSETDEIRLDVTSQLTDKWKVRSGIDFKSHKLNYYQVSDPWLGTGAFTQSFAEFWDDVGLDGLSYDDQGYPGIDEGEGNGDYDEGEPYKDANGNGKWDNFREPREVSFYINNIFEVPWMVVNAGIRFDGVNYNTQIWADPQGNPSPTRPWYYADANDNDVWDSNEEYDDDPGFANQKVIMTEADWFFKVSPRFGVSHIITDRATFTFNYGYYYQTPTYRNVYLNTNRQEDPEELFEESTGAIGNATMNSQRTQSYEFGFNVQFSRHWAFSLMGWVKDMDQLTTSKIQRSGVYEYSVFDNGDFGGARGIDFTLENRGLPINSLIQYTYSQAKANSEYDWASLGNQVLEAPAQEFLMPYDRTHDLTVTLYTTLPFRINASLTGFFQSGQPYTPLIPTGTRGFMEDQRNKFTMRAPDFKNVNLSFSKFIKMKNLKIQLGLNVFNLLDIRNEHSIFPLTGRADDPGTFYTDQVGLADEDHDKSNSFYDVPWYYSSPRQVNFFVRMDFN